MPQSGESKASTTGSTAPGVSTLPKLPSPVWTAGERSTNAGDILTYTSCAQLYSRHETCLESATPPYTSTRFENGIRTMGHSQSTSGGSSVTVVVDTLANASRPPLTSTWTMATMREASSQIQEQSLKHQRKPQLQKRYLESTTVTSFQQAQPPPPKQESVSYVQLIASAILATPEKRATLAQIYEWLVTNVAAFQGQGGSPSSVGWKVSVAFIELICMRCRRNNPSTHCGRERAIR